MLQVVNNKYRPLYTTSKRYGILMGGRGAGRSTVESQYVLSKLMAPDYFRCAIMRFVLSDIRNSNFREILDRAEEQGILDQLDVNESQMTISYGANSIHAHGFRKSSGDQSAKLKSLANYNHVWVEEADEVPEEDFMQLDDSLRTTKGDIRVHLTFNPPPKSHWIIKRWFGLGVSEQPGFYIPHCTHDDVLFIHSDWHDNAQNIDEGTKKRYEEYKNTKPNHYWNMIKGYVPEVVQGRIYKDWKLVDDVPHEARLECYGLDFGFNPDPAAIVAIYFYNGGYIVDEILYQRDLLNRQLATVLINNPKAIVVGDAAEPKSIEEMKEYDVDIIPCVKGADSVRFGIKRVQALKVSVTKRSKNIWREYENYHWLIDKDGEEHEKEDPNCDNHSMSAIRYGLSLVVPDDPIEKTKREMERATHHRERNQTVRADAGL